MREALFGIVELQPKNNRVNLIKSVKHDQIPMVSRTLLDALCILTNFQKKLLLKSFRSQSHESNVGLAWLWAFANAQIVNREYVRITAKWDFFSFKKRHGKFVGSETISLLQFQLH